MREEKGSGQTGGGRGPLTVAFAIQEWPTEGRPAGGAGIYVGKIARALAQAGHHVHVVTCAHADIPSETIEDGVHVHRLAEDAPNARDPVALERYSRAVAARLSELDALEGFDIVEFQEWAAEGWAFHPRPDQAMVVRLQAPSHFVRQFEYADGSATERRVDEMERWPVERADLVTAPSRLIADFAARTFTFDPRATTIIPNGVDAVAFGGSPSVAQPAGGPVVLCVNRLSPIKGPEVFVRAAARVHREHPAARFVMVGRVDAIDGEPADVALRRLASDLGLPADRLEIRGPAGHDDLPSVYAQADVCVNPSMNESYSLTSAEALACGRPCVLSDGMGITEFLTDGHDCLLAPAGDDAAFADRIVRLLRDDRLRAAMGTAARNTATKTLSTAATALATERAYRRTLAVVRARRPIAQARLTIAILTHNALDCTKRCLASLAAHTTVPHNIFVLDNASTDETPDWLARTCAPNLHVTWSDRNLGVPGGRNALLRTILPYVADDGFIVFMDNDIEVLPGWHEPFLEFFDRNPAAGIAGEIGHPIVVHEHHRELLPMPAPPAAVDVASGGFCCFVRAACARETGLFDERLGLFWHEDDDYCVRAIARGFGVFALRAGRVVHHEHASGVALPGVATGGSPANQRYLVEKWRGLGFVDATGRIAHASHDGTQALRSRLGERLGRGGPIPPEELERAARDLSALLMSGDVLAHVEARQSDLGPTLRALLDVNAEDARACGRTTMAAALDEIRAIVSTCRLSAMLRPHVTVPRSPASEPRGARRLSKLCDTRDWDAPVWRALATDIFGEAGSRNWYERHRKFWEGAQVAYAVECLVEDMASASGLVVNAAAEPLTFGLAKRVRSIVAADAYGSDPAAPAAMLSHPDRLAPFAFPQNRLLVVDMPAARLAFPDETFDFAVVCALHRLGSVDAAATVLAAAGRAVKPGGFVIAVAEVALNGMSRAGVFTPPDLGRVVEASGLDTIEDMDFAIDDATLDGFVDLARGAGQRPHLVLCAGDLLFTSGVLALQRAAVPVAP